MDIIPDSETDHFRQSIRSDGGEHIIDRILNALSDEHCRYILYHLSHHDPATLDSICDTISQNTTRHSDYHSTREQKEKIKTTLHHIHLPKLDTLGLIEYDARNGDVRYRSPPHHLEDILTIVRELENPDVPK